MIKFALLTCLAVLLGGGAISQDTLRITEPHDSYGYLSWTTSDKVKDWTININQKVWQWSDSTYIDSLVYKQKLAGDVHYYKIPPQYWNKVDGNTYQINLTGTDNSGTPVVTSYGPVGPTGVTECMWQCVGGNYAYNIVQGLKPDGTRIYTIEQAFDEFDEETGIYIPYYRYFGNDEWCSYTSLVGYETSYGSPAECPLSGNGDPSHHEIVNTPFWNGNWYDDYPMRIQKIETIGINSDYKNINGETINENMVYAVQKGRGFIYENFEVYHTTPIVGDYCLNMASIDQVINQVILPYTTISADFPQSEGYPVFGCQATGGSEVGQNGVDWPCVTTFEYIDTYDYSIFNVIECHDPIGGTDSIGYDNITSISEAALQLEKYQIIQVTDSGKIPLYNYSKTDFIDSNGNVRFPSFTTGPGLYQYILKFKGRTPVYFYFETNTTNTATVKDADFVSVKHYPNPIANNEFSVDIFSRKNISTVTHILVDKNGYEYYSGTYSLSANQSITKLIKPAQTLPKELISILKFPDGSSVTAHLRSL